MKKLAFILPLLFLLHGCSSLAGGTETRFYSLSASSKPDEKLAGSAVKLGVGPVKLPQLLKRPQIVTRINQNELKIVEEHQWAGSLKEDITQALTDNLSSLLGTEQIQKFPWKRAFKPTYQVRVNIERLDGEPGEKVLLQARWWLRTPTSGTDLLARKSSFEAQTKGNDYNAYVAALSDAVYQLSIEIAQTARGR